MNYVVLDMEWNQPWGCSRLIKTPAVLYGEIVQIGAVKLDENYRMIDTFKIMVLPKFYKKMHRKVRELTNITTEELQYGFPFEVAFKHFKKWCGDDFIFLTWGADDIDILRSNMVINEIDTGWVPNAYNIQAIFDDQVTKENRQISLTYAMEKFGEEALESHDALNDARNAARICFRLDMEKGMNEYSELIKKIKVHGKCAIDRVEDPNVYAEKKDVFDNPKMIRFSCPFCGEEVECVDIIKQNSKKYIGIGKCKSGKELFVRYVFRKTESGHYSVVRFLYGMDKAYKELYQSKKNKYQYVDTESTEGETLDENRLMCVN